MHTPEELMAMAVRCRQLAERIRIPKASRRLQAAAEEFEARAMEIQELEAGATAETEQGLAEGPGVARTAA